MIPTICFFFWGGVPVVHVTALHIRSNDGHKILFRRYVFLNAVGNHGGAAVDAQTWEQFHSHAVTSFVRPFSFFFFFFFFQCRRPIPVNGRDLPFSVVSGIHSEVERQNNFSAFPFSRSLCY